MSPTIPTLRTKLFYGFGSVAFGVKDNGFAFLLLLYYNQVLGLPERWVGFGILVALVLDACFDPIVGYISDHLHSRWGRRHPFLYGSALPVAVAYYFLWSPPEGLSQSGLLTYFFCIALLVRLLISFYEIPSSALAAELTDDYDQRTSLLGFRFFFGWWGGLTMSVLAFAVFLQPDATHPVGQLNPAGYRTYGLVSSIIMAVAILVSAAGTHSRIPYLRLPPENRHLGFVGALREFIETLRNPSFIALFGFGVFAAMAAGLAAALSVYFNTFFWELNTDEISILVLANFVSAAAALALVPVLSTRFGGKKPAAMATAVAAGFVGPAPMVLRLLGWLPDNHTTALLLILLLFNTVAVTLIIVASILLASMLADVVEDSEISTGRRSEGVFFAANSFVQKSVSGIGIFGSTLLLSAIGFPVGAKPGEVDPTVVRNLGLVYIPILLLLYGGALAFLTAYRISRAGHAENLARLGR